MACQQKPGKQFWKVRRTFPQQFIEFDRFLEMLLGYPWDTWRDYGTRLADAPTHGAAYAGGRRKDFLNILH